MSQPPSRLATLLAWLETAAMPSLTGLAVGVSSGLSMGGPAGWIFGAAASCVAILVGVVLAERERRQGRRHSAAPPRRAAKTPY